MATKRPPEYYLPLWEHAEKEELGIEIMVEPGDAVILISALYECRKGTNGRFEGLIICQPPPEGTIFITHKTVELP